MNQTVPLRHPGDITVATYNVQKGFGLDLRRDPGRTHRVITDLDADIVALQEADRRFNTRAGVLDLARLEAECGLVPVPIQDRTGLAAHGWHGNLLLTRGAVIERVRTLRLPGVEPRGAVIADIVQGGIKLRIIAVHMGLLSSARILQAGQLADEIATDGRPTILLGDTNEWRRGPASTLAPLYAHFRQHGIQASYPAPRPILPLDRIFVSHPTRRFDLSVHMTAPARTASDHLPLVARIGF